MMAMMADQAGDGDAVFGEEANGVGDGESDDDAGEASDERDQDGLGEKLKTNFAVGGADGFADADLADARGHGGEHDVHDADAADHQRHHGNQQQHPGQAGGDAVGHGEHGGEVLDVVDRLGAVARLQDALDLRGRREHHGASSMEK